MPRCSSPSRLDPGAEPGGAQQVDAGALQDPGPDPRRDVLLGARLDDDRLDPVLREQVGEQQAGRAGPDDGNVSPHGSLYRDNRARHRRLVLVGPRRVALAIQNGEVVTLVKVSD